jgi:hypothetical protein
MICIFNQLPGNADTAVTDTLQTIGLCQELSELLHKIWIDMEVLQLTHLLDLPLTNCCTCHMYACILLLRTFIFEHWETNFPNCSNSKYIYYSLKVSLEEKHNFYKPKNSTPSKIV